MPNKYESNPNDDYTIPNHFTKIDYIKSYFIA